jgi:glycosyltransferase involved in cell wall biosynthesis
VTEVHVIVPEGIDDPARPSGGNTYDRRLLDGLTTLGWFVREHAVPGAWPQPGEIGHAALAGVVRRIPDGAVVLLDGLVACAAPEMLVPHALRLRQIVLVHMPLGDPAVADEARAREHEVLGGTAAVVTTSAWTRRRLLELYALAPERVHVAEPGVDAAELASGSAAGDALLCVAAVTRGKGHDVLLDAFATATELPWLCACVGSLDRDPAFADRVRRRAWRRGLDDRIRFTGPRTGPDLDRAYAAADLLVLPSRAETYGMVVTEALARGVPVVATDVGGVTEALGHAEDGARPGLLVPADDPAALGAALRRWLEEPELRERLRRAARERRASLRPWPAAASDVAGVLRAAAIGADPVARAVAGAAR